MSGMTFQEVAMPYIDVLLRSGKAVDLTKDKLHEISKTKLTAADQANAEFVSQVII